MRSFLFVLCILLTTFSTQSLKASDIDPTVDQTSISGIIKNMLRALEGSEENSELHTCECTCQNEQCECSCRLNESKKPTRGEWVIGLFRSLTDVTTWKEHIHSLNPKNMALNLNRYLSMNKGSQETITNHIFNVALLWPVSESIEVFSGPAFFFIGNYLSLPTYLTMSGGSLMSFFALPGICPLCFLILTTYPIPIVHKSVTSVRRFLHRILSTKITERGSLVAFKNRNEELNDDIENFNIKFKHYAWRAHDDKSFELLDLDSDESILQIEFNTSYNDDSQTMYVKTIKLNSNYLQRKKVNLKKLSSIFGWNVANLVKDFQKEIKKGKELSRKFYIEKITESDEITVALKPNAVTMSKKIKLLGFERERYDRYDCKAYMTENIAHDEG